MEDSLLVGRGRRRRPHGVVYSLCSIIDQKLSSGVRFVKL